MQIHQKSKSHYSALPSPRDFLFCMSSLLVLSIYNSKTRMTNKHCLLNSSKGTPPLYTYSQARGLGKHASVIISLLGCRKEAALTLPRLLIWPHLTPHLWPKSWALIGRGRSRDLNTALWLVHQLTSLEHERHRAYSVSPWHQGVQGGGCQGDAEDPGWQEDGPAAGPGGRGSGHHEVGPHHRVTLPVTHYLHFCLDNR